MLKEDLIWTVDLWYEISALKSASDQSVITRINDGVKCLSERQGNEKAVIWIIGRDY